MIVLDVYRREARNLVAIMGAIVATVKRVGVYRIVNSTGRIVEVFFIPGKGELLVEVHRGVEKVHGRIRSETELIVDFAEPHWSTYEVKKNGKSDVYVAFKLKDGEEIVVWSWVESRVKPVLYVFGGERAYERAVDFINKLYVGMVALRERHG